MSISNAPGALDRAALSLLENDLGRDSVLEMIVLFVDDGTKQLEAARAAVASGEAKKLQFVAHRIKSMSHYLGARALSAACGEIERACDGQPDLAAELARLEALFTPAKVELQAWAAAPR